MNHVLIPYNWKEFIYHRGSVYNQVSITKSGKERKEGRQTVFFTPLDPFGSDAHEQEEPSEDYSRPRKVHHHSRWGNDQNTVYCVELSRAQDLRLQFGQTKSNAIIVHQSVPYRCIDRVVGDNGGRIIFQRILTPRPGPKVILRDTWIPQQQQQQQKEQQPQPQYSESGNCSGKPLASGDRTKAGTRSTI